MYLRLLLNFIIYFFSQNSCKLAFDRLKYIRNSLPKRGVVPMSCLRCSALELRFPLHGLHPYHSDYIYMAYLYVYSCGSSIQVLIHRS